MTGVMTYMRFSVVDRSLYVLSTVSPCLFDISCRRF